MDYFVGNRRGDLSTKSGRSLFGFPVALITLGKVCVQLFSLQ